MIREINLHRLSSQGLGNGVIERHEVNMIIGATPHTDIPKAGRNAAIYLRTSTKEQNPANQLNDCIAFCNKISISEYEVFSEQKSARRREKNREVFDTLVKNLEHKKYAVLVIWRYDRMYRNMKKFTKFMETMFVIPEVQSKPQRYNQVYLRS